MSDLGIPDISSTEKNLSLKINELDNNYELGGSNTPEIPSPKESEIALDEIDYSDDDYETSENESDNESIDLDTQSTTKEIIPDDDDDDDDDDEDDLYLQKLDKDIKNNYIEEYHPETFIHNFDEVRKLTIVTRNKDGIVIDPLHKTIPILTKYEKTRILGQRTKQINAGANPLIKVNSDVLDGYLIANEELKMKKIPFIIRRPLPGGGFEYWNVKDLELI